MFYFSCSFSGFILVTLDIKFLAALNAVFILSLFLLIMSNISWVCEIVAVAIGRSYFSLGLFLLTFWRHIPLHYYCDACNQSNSYFPACVAFVININIDNWFSNFVQYEIRVNL